MSARARQAAGAAQRGDGQDGARVAKARRSAWLLAGLALFFYVGYMAWMYVRANVG
jgi:hypothetical protein